MNKTKPEAELYKVLKKSYLQVVEKQSRIKLRNITRRCLLYEKIHIYAFHYFKTVFLKGPTGPRSRRNDPRTRQVVCR